MSDLGDLLSRQSGVVWQDLVVELCGRMFHDSALGFDADLERDLDVAVNGRPTVRLGWGQVFRRACPTAAKLGVILRSRGWENAPVPCDYCTGRSFGGTPVSPDGTCVPRSLAAAWTSLQ